MPTDVNKHLLFENNQGKYLLSLDNPYYIVKRSQEGEIESIRCNIILTFTDEGKEDFAKNNTFLLDSLDYYTVPEQTDSYKVVQQPDSKLLSQIAIDYIFDFTSQKYIVKNVWLSYKNDFWGSSCLKQKLDLTNLLKGISTTKILPQVIFFIQSQYRMEPTGKLFFLTENSLRTTYIDKESYNTFISMPKVKPSATIDLDIVDYYTNFGAKEMFFDPENYSTDKIDYKLIAYSTQNYLIDPINKRFLPGKKSWHYSNGKIKYSTPLKWENFDFYDENNYEKLFLDEPNSTPEHKAQLMLLYALYYDKALYKYDFSKLPLEKECLQYQAQTQQTI